MHESWQELLPLYVNDRLTHEDRQLLDDHLADCEECRNQLWEWRMLAQAAARRVAIKTLRNELPPLVLPVNSHSPQHRKHSQWRKNKMFVSIARPLAARPQPRLDWLAPVLMFMMTAVAVAILFLFSLSQSPIIGNLQRPEDRNMEVFRRYIDEAWNAGNLPVLDEILTSDYVRHDSLVSDGMPGAEAERELITLFRTAAPDLHVAIDNITADGDRIMARMAISGTLTAPLQLSSDLLIPGNGQPFTLSTIHSVRFEDEKMAEMWVATDPQDLMQQLGAVVHLQTVAHNDDWTPITANFDGVEMVLVPSGRFMMGTAEEDAAAYIQECSEISPVLSDDECQFWAESEMPRHEVVIDHPFWIDVNEVTNQQFDQNNGEALRRAINDPDQPRVNINWEESRNFCEMRGGRLPTEAEWEYAARGPESLTYPWGGELDPTRLNYCDVNCTESWHDPNYDDGYRTTAPISTYSPAGDSWVGAADMLGNVWEWTSTIFDQDLFPYPYVFNDGREDDASASHRVMRGASYDNPILDLYTSIRFEGSPYGTYYNFLGFRCVRDYEGMPMSAASSDTTQTLPEDNAGRFEAYTTQAWNGGDLAVLDRLFTENYLRHDPMVAEGATDPEATVISMFRTGLPDLQVTIDELVRDGDRVWAQLTLTGTHTGLFAYNDSTLIPASGNSITLTMSNLARFEDGQIAEMWVELDTLDLLQQLDVSVVLQPVAHNDDWTPIIQEFDGVEMVLVPPGRFMMGTPEELGAMNKAFCLEVGRSESECQGWVDMELPIHELSIDRSFWIDRYEVTNQQFDQFGGEARLDADTLGADHPRRYISWTEAQDFCELRGARLSTEAEWEYAARGPDSLAYPWGNEFDPTRLNYCDTNCTLADSLDSDNDDGYQDTAPVGTYSPAGDSWVGAADMVGNVWEWTSTIYDQTRFPYPYDPTDGREDTTVQYGSRVIRGSGYRNDTAEMYPSYRYGSATSIADQFVGFRCVRDYDSMPSTTASSTDTAETLPEDNAGRFETYVNQAWNGGDLAVLDGLFTDGYVRHDPMVAEGVTDPEATVISMFRTGLPDLQVTIDDLITDGDRVWAKLTLTGTHTGLFAYNDTTLIPASGNSITLTASNLVRFEEGQIAEMWVELDTLDLLGQLDVSVVLQPVAHNDDWTPIIQEFDGVEMVLVPAGRFMMGLTEEQLDAVYEKCMEADIAEGNCSQMHNLWGPKHEVVIENPFWIDRYEVSNAQFNDLDGVALRDSHQTDNNFPRTNIIWEEAQDFCELRGGRLPTEAEWEYAARGPDSLYYPWGDEFDPTRVNYCDSNCTYPWRDESFDDGYEGASPVDAFSPAGDSWVGTAEMASNVWEWLNTVNRPYPYEPADGREDGPGPGDQVAQRGGGYVIYGLNASPAARGINDPDFRGPEGGFRCVRDYDG